MIYFILLHVAATSEETAPQDEVSPSQTSLTALDNMWRYGGHYDFEPSMLDDSDELKDYMIGIVSIAAFGVVPAVLLLLFALPWCCARTFCRRCCKCCQGHARKRDKWTCFNIWSARITAITCILIFIVFGGLAYHANHDLSDSFWEDNSGMYDILRNELMGDMVDFSDTIFLQLGVIYDAAVENGTIDQNVEILERWRSEIENGNDDIVAQMDTYCGNVNDANVDILSTQYYVTSAFHIQQDGICDAWVSEVQAWADGTTFNGQYQEGVWPTFDDTLNTVVDTMGDVRSDIWDAVGSVMDDIVVPARDSASDFKVVLDDRKVELLDFEDTRAITYNVFFSLPIIPFVVVLLGCTFKSPWLLTAAYAISWWIAFLLFIILGIHLPIAGFAQDFCQFLDVTEKNGFESTLNVSASLADMGKIADACIENSKLVSVFDLDSQLNFTSEVTFPSVHVDDFFSFTTWNEYIDGMPTNYIDAYSPELPTVHDVPTCTSTFQDVVDEAELVVLKITDTRDVAQQIMDDMLAVENTFDPVFTAGDKIVNETRCGFIGASYVKFKKNTCEDALAALSLMCACIGVNAIFCTILTIVIIRCRKQFKKPKGEFFFEEDIEMAAANDIVEKEKSKKKKKKKKKNKNANQINGERAEVGLAPNEILI